MITLKTDSLCLELRKETPVGRESIHAYIPPRRSVSAAPMAGPVVAVWRFGGVLDVESTPKIGIGLPLQFHNHLASHLFPFSFKGVALL